MMAGGGGGGLPLGAVWWRCETNCSTHVELRWRMSRCKPATFPPHMPPRGSFTFTCYEEKWNPSKQRTRLQSVCCHSSGYLCEEVSGSGNRYVCNAQRACSVSPCGTRATPYRAMHPAAQSETVQIEGKALWGMVNARSTDVLCIGQTGRTSKRERKHSSIIKQRERKHSSITKHIKENCTNIWTAMRCSWTVQLLFYAPPGSALANSTFCSHSYTFCLLMNLGGKKTIISTHMTFIMTAECLLWGTNWNCIKLKSHWGSSLDIIMKVGNLWEVPN